MTKVVQLYYYLFYKYYKFLGSNPITKGETKFKAIMTLIILELWTVFSAINYRDIFLLKTHGTKRSFLLPMLIASIIVLIIKWYAFSKDDRWKDYIEKFEKWPKEKNRKGTLVVLILTVLLVANFVVSAYFNPAL